MAIDTINLGCESLSFQIFGGVQQWWMEGGVAAWSPFSSLAVLPLPSANLLFGLATAFIDTITSNLLSKRPLCKVHSSRSVSC